MQIPSATVQSPYKPPKVVFGIGFYHDINSGLTAKSIFFRGEYSTIAL